MNSSQILTEDISGGKPIRKVSSDWHNARLPRVTGCFKSFLEGYLSFKLGCMFYTSISGAYLAKDLPLEVWIPTIVSRQ